MSRRASSAQKLYKTVSISPLFGRVTQSPKRTILKSSGSLGGKVTSKSLIFFLPTQPPPRPPPHPSGHTVSQGFGPARWEGCSLTAWERWAQSYLCQTHSEGQRHCSVNSLELVLSQDRAAEGFLRVPSKDQAL